MKTSIIHRTSAPTLALMIGLVSGHYLGGGTGTTTPAPAFMPAPAPAVGPIAPAGRMVARGSHGPAAAKAPGSPFAMELDVGRRQMLLADLLAATGIGDWEGLVTRLLPDLTSYETQGLLAAWAQADGAAAFDFVKHRDSQTRNEEMQAVTEAWAAADPAAAIAAMRLSAGDALRSLPGILAVVGRTDVEMVEEALLAADPAAAAVSAQRLLPILSEQPPRHLEDFLGRIPDEEAWTQTRTACFASLARAKLEALDDLACWAGEHLADEAFRAGALPVIAQSMPPAAALNWLEQLAVDRATAESVGLEIVQRWMESDSAGASGWVAGHPECTWYDEAAALVANTVFLEDPEAAAAWAGSIHGPQRRLVLLESMAPKENEPAPDSSP